MRYSGIRVRNSSGYRSARNARPRSRARLRFARSPRAARLCTRHASRGRSKRENPSRLRCLRCFTFVRNIRAQPVAQRQLALLVLKLRSVHVVDEVRISPARTPGASARDRFGLRRQLGRPLLGILALPRRLRCHVTTSLQRARHVTKRDDRYPRTCGSSPWWFS